jgi:hypothetical protein
VPLRGVARINFPKCVLELPYAVGQLTDLVVENLSVCEYESGEDEHRHQGVDGK